MKFAVEGCAHGELEQIYDTIQSIEQAENIKIDLLLCCGDFQATRNLEDLQTMAVPPKYLDMCTFYKYYSGELVAPILTIFIGGNHEASNHLQELPYGGWVAPNIYYLGYAGVVRVNGVRIAGLSGIYKGHDYLRGRFEYAPYTDTTRTSVYHVRQLEVFRLKQLSGIVDICISHDWPRGIYNYGNKAQLARFKPHFRDEMENLQLGSRPCEDLLKLLKPSMWFAAHLHCKFAAVVRHDEEDEFDAIENADQQKTDERKEENVKEERVTKFLALDKCLPQRRFLQVLDIACENELDEGVRLEYDLEWLTVLYLTNHLTNVKSAKYYLPGPQNAASGERYNFTPTAEELEHVRQKFGGDLVVPRNFCRTVEPYSPCDLNVGNVAQPKAQINPQSQQFCDTLGIDDPVSLALIIGGHELSFASSLDDSTTSDLNDSCLSMLTEQSSLSISSSTDSSSQPTTPFKSRKTLGLSLPKPSAAAGSVADGGSSLVSPRQVAAANPDEVCLEHSSADEAEEEPAAVNQIEEQPDKDQPLEDEPSMVIDTKEVQVEGQLTKHESAVMAQAEAECPKVGDDDALNSKPPIKKFKRRNQSLYMADAADEEKS